MAERELLRSDLVQRNHRVGHGKDEVDVVLRHLLCDQSERGVILQGVGDRCCLQKVQNAQC